MEKCIDCSQINNVYQKKCGKYNKRDNDCSDKGDYYISPYTEQQILSNITGESQIKKKQESIKKQNQKYFKCMGSYKDVAPKCKRLFLGNYKCNSQIPMIKELMCEHGPPYLNKSSMKKCMAKNLKYAVPQNIKICKNSYDYLI